MEPSHNSPENLSTDSSILRRDAILSAIAYAGQQFLRSDDWDTTVDAVLERLGRATDVERVYVFADHTGRAGKQVASLRYEWVAPTGQRLLANRGLQETPYFRKSTARWRERLQAGEIVAGKIDESALATRKVLRLLLVRSFVAVPVFVAGHWWGAVGFADSQSNRDWSDAELDALQVAASLLGAAFERQRIAQERAESERFWALMSHLSAAGLEAVDEKTLLSATVDQLADVIHADHCLIILWDDAEQRIVTAAGTPAVARMISLFSASIPPRSIMNTLLQERRTLLFDDLMAVVGKYSKLIGYVPLVSGIAVPMIAQNEVLGVVMLGFATLHQVTTVEQKRAELATQQLARFLFNARLLRAETQARQQAETLQAVGHAINSTLDLREVLERILSELQRVVPYDSASVQRQEGDKSVIIAVQGFDDSFERVGLAFDIHDSGLPNKTIYQDQRPAIVADVRTTHAGFGAAADGSDYIHSWLGVPLVFGGQTVGMLSLDKTDTGFYTEQHASTAEAFAAQAAIALENARLFEVTRQLNTQVWRQAEQLRQVIDTVSDAIVLLDADNSIVLANTTFYEYLPALTGQPRTTVLDQICGRPIGWFLEEDDDVGWREATSEGETHRIFAISANRVSIGPDVGGLVVTITDVTIEREQRQARRTQERLATIGALASSIAHDFNNILQGIIGFSDLLSKNPDIPANARNRLALMAAEGQRGADLVRMIVEYGRDVPLNARQLELAGLINGAARQWQTSVERPILVSLEEGEPLWSVNGDAVRLLETIAALVADAAQTVPAGQPVTIHLANRNVASESAARRTGNTLGRCVAIRIMGGHHWFDSTEQVHALQNDLPLIQIPAGRDVVLAQVQGVVRQHRGAITVDAQPDGSRGVTIMLPAAAGLVADWSPI